MRLLFHLPLVKVKKQKGKNLVKKPCSSESKRFVPYFSILVAPLIELVKNYVPSWEDAQERGFQTLPYSNIPNTTNIYVFILFTCVEGRSPELQEPLDLRSTPFQGEGNDAILPPKGIG